MYRVVDGLARLFALLGGIVLSALIVLTCASVLGRAVNSFLNSAPVEQMMTGLASLLLATGVGPIYGDFEIVEAGMAFSIFAFLPLCQLHSAHASVDVFTSFLSARANRALLLVIEIVFAAALILIAAELFSGMMSKRHSGQTTLLLQFPVWWSYAASVSAASVAALVASYMAGIRVLEVVQGRAILPDESGLNE